MTKSIVAPLLLAMAAGMMVPFQSSANSHLAKVVGHPLWAATIALLLATVMIALLAIWTPLPPRSAVKGAPPWIWLGGACSVVFVFATIQSAPRLGAGLFSAVAFGGQFLAALTVDQAGWLGFPQRPLTTLKLVGGVLILAGVSAMLAAERQSPSACHT